LNTKIIPQNTHSIQSKSSWHNCFS